MTDAQRDLVLSLDFRTEATGKIADQIRSALGSSEAGPARAQIAGEMQAYLASDVIVSQRVVPLLDQVLRDNGSRPQTTFSPFLPDLGWLNPSVLGARLDGQAGGTARGPVKPGRHGHQLVSVSVNGTTLTPGVTSTITSTGKPTFTLSILNQGDNDETNVPVEVRVTGAGPPIVGRTTLPKTTAGQTATATVTLPQKPPSGQPLTITASVQPVPGEITTSNNTNTYTAVFTG
jgi:hypothetical protein